MVNNVITASKSWSGSHTDDVVIASPGSGRRIVIDSISAWGSGPVLLESGTSTAVLEIDSSSVPFLRIVLADNQPLTATSASTTKHGIIVNYHIE